VYQFLLQVPRPVSYLHKTTGDEKAKYLNWQVAAKYRTFVVITVGKR
jgi:hypothetical protein